MIAINPTGTVACLTPAGAKGSSGTYSCDVYIMPGTIPANDVLESILTSSEMVTAYPSYIYKFSGLSLTTSFSFYKNERSFKKSPVDALEFTSLASGTAGWAALVFSGEKIIFTDSIGNWDDDEAVITLSSLICATGEQNILKDINLIIREKSTYELNPNGIFQG